MSKQIKDSENKGKILKKIQKTVEESEKIGETGLDFEEDGNEKYIAIAQADGELIMISSKESPILETLKTKEGVEVIPVAEFRERFKHLPAEEIASMEEKLESLIMLDEVEEINQEMLTEAYDKKEALKKIRLENLQKKADIFTSSGYIVKKNSEKGGLGTIIKNKHSARHQNRNDKCQCGSGKKFKACCQPMYASKTE